MLTIPRNIALGCPCRQSSAAEDQPVDAGANQAVNGVRTGHAAFTTLKEDAPWWQVDLGRRARLDSVVVYNWDLPALPYSEAGRSRSRFLQVWGSDDATEWQLLHDRREGQSAVSSFGGVHHGPLCVPLTGVEFRYVRLGLAGGGILQLDEVEVYSLQPCDTDDALRDLMKCADGLNFAQARRILDAARIPPAALPGHIERLGIAPGPFGTVFAVNLLVESHLAYAAHALLATHIGEHQQPARGQAAAAGTPPLSLHIPPAAGVRAPEGGRLPGADDRLDPRQRVLAALARGESPASIEASLGAMLETVLGEEFEPALQLDFDAIVENDILGTDTNARRYQATSSDAFFKMMKHVPFVAGEPFVDVGSGKGKMLYYAFQLGYTKGVGMEISPALLARARANFERLQLPMDIRLWQRDASCLDLAELDEFSLFYLSNPFGEIIMRAFLHTLVASQRRIPRILRIVYCVAMVEEPFATHGFEPVQVFEPGVGGWRAARSVIYERRPD